MDEKIESMTEAGKILGEVLEELLEFVEPGVSELEIDNLAERLIAEKGGEPGFKKVPGYKYTICISTNNVVVHGIPTYRKLKEGDIVGIDCGVYLNGYHTDMAETVVVGKSGRSRNEEFLAAGKKALFKGIKAAKAGSGVGNISQEIQKLVEGKGYSIVRSLVGHGVGKQLHEKPDIPGYLSDRIEKTPELKPGMTIAVEVIYNMGKPGVTYDEGDDWTIVTEDGSLSGLFERTVLVTENEPKLITRLSTDKL